MSGFEKTLSTLPIVLASASPRRHELLDQVGIAYDARPVSIDETPRADETSVELVTRLAIEKATAALPECDARQVILGADTVVVVDHQILEKPQNRADARRLLDALSGRDHEVLSAAALSFVAESGQRRIETRLNRSRVWFRDITAAECSAYCETDEPMDKAGAYAIQGVAAMFVTRLEGSYSAVMGLPLFETLALLSLAGVSPLADS